jgi:hypothetical protein
MPDPARVCECRSACMKEWGRVKVARARENDSRRWRWLVLGVPSVAVFPSRVSRLRAVSGQARLPRHVFAPVLRMMGSLATARLGSIS